MKQVQLFSLKEFYILCPPLCLINRLSIFRFCVLFFFVFSGLEEVKGQNVINIYQDFEDDVSNWVQKTEYDGEYIMDIHSATPRYSESQNTWTNPYEKPHLLENIWFNANKCYSGPRQLAADADLVSFPFWPNRERTDLDNNTDRILTVLKDEDLKNLKYNSTRNVLSSVLFEEPDVTAESRNYIPHSIFRHKLYIHCGRQEYQQPTTDPLEVPTPTPNGPAGVRLDSLVFTVDLTRSQMRYYPFNPENNVNLSTEEFDIILHPFFMLNDNYEAIGNDLDEINYYDLTNINIDLCEEFPCSQNTLNYYPAEDVTNLDICDEVDCLYPVNPNANLEPNRFIHPSPFSLAGFLMQGENSINPAGYKTSASNPNILEKKEGIKHTYIIDENINLNLINPNEKIIYNPSEVHIEATDLVFPSGYTFKTVRGLYPTVDEVANTTICDAADELEDQRLVHVATDLQNTVNFTTSEGVTLTAPAFYVLEPGSKLTIEPCVSIFDVTFVVRIGAELVYHPSQTYGNFQIVEEAADVTSGPDKVIEVNLPNKTCNDCRCVQEYTIDQDLIIEDGESVVWASDQTVRGQVTVKNGGELQILACKVEFTDADANATDDVVFTGIKVEAGGKLKLRYADLTILNGDQSNNCAQRHQSWDGIHLKGINPQAVGEHAVLDAQNSSISYAKRAIHTEGFVYNDFGENNWICGGDVSAKNITFTNNHISYYAVNTNPLNGFMGCTFEREAAHPNRESNMSDEFISHVFLFNQQDLKFRNCVFKNHLSTIDPDFTDRESLLKLPFIEDRGTGILAYDSEFEVSTKHPPFDEPAPMNDTSRFEGLYRGIVTHSFGDRSIDVRETHFNNTLQCITTNGNMEDNITDQNIFTFDIAPFFEQEIRPEDNLPPSTYDAWAVYSFGSNEYEISENIINFEGFYYTPPVGGAGTQFNIIKPNYYGIIVNNTAAGSGMVNENEFNVAANFRSEFVEKLTGTQTEENNDLTEMLCNEYFNFQAYQQWLINPISPNDNPSFPNLLADQGTGCGAGAAGNLFELNCSETENIKVGFLHADFIYWPTEENQSSIFFPNCTGVETGSVGAVLVDDCVGVNSSLTYEDLCPNGNSGSGVVGKALVNSKSPTGIAVELNNGSYDETEKTLLTTAVYKIYEEAEQESDAIVFLEAMNTKHSNSILMKKYLNKGLLLEAQNKLNALHGGGVYDASYLQFYQLLIDVQVNGRKYTELTATELQTVENIVQANTYGSVYAESLLAMLNQTTIDRVPHKEGSQSNKQANVSELSSAIQIYPNPSNGRITVESLVKEAKLLVYNITGQLIKQETLELGKNQLKIHVPNGTYFFKIESKQQTTSHKVIISQ